VGEVAAVAGADLEHPAGQAGEQGAAEVGGALGIHGRADAGIDPSEDRVAWRSSGWRRFGHDPPRAGAGQVAGLVAAMTT
jgi:hypothetical protein